MTNDGNSRIPHTLRRKPLVVSLLALLSIAAAPTANPSTTDFLRFVPDKVGGGTLQTATTRYRNAAGATVDLIAAVHVADSAYYHQVEKSFKQYDALLYEMVKPQGMAPPAPGAKAGGAVTGLQRFLKKVLDLDFQLDAIDYSAPNFVHADLDAETFAQMQGDRGESIPGIILQSMLREMAKEDGANGDVQLGQLLMALQAPDRAKQLKLLLARQFNDVEDALSGLGGPDGSVILTERNKRALTVLDEQLHAGKKHLAIFYGAAHLPDMAQRLSQRGFKRVGSKWQVAWNMAGPPATRPTTLNTK